MSRHDEILHERDRLLEQVAELQKALEVHEQKHRHWVSVSCDRCKTSLTLSSSTGTDDKMTKPLYDAAISAEWDLSGATATDLSGVSHLSRDPKDWCPACADLIESPIITLPVRSSR